MIDEGFATALLLAGARYEGDAADLAGPVKARWGRAILRAAAGLNAAIVEALRAELRNQRMHAVLSLQQVEWKTIFCQSLEKGQSAAPLVALR